MPVWLSADAWAACTPAAGSNVIATCTGATSNQNAPNGYGAGTESPLTVTVVPGATVTGANAGISFKTGTVFNFGAISGSGAGVSAVGNATVTNAGVISGEYAISAGGNATVTNSGVISGGAYGILAADGVAVTNSGVISGKTGILASGAPSTLVNSGAIIGTGGAGGAAIDFSSFHSDSLTFLPGSKIIGAINLGARDTVNFNGGNQNLSFNSRLPDTTFAGTTPFAVSGNHAAAIDPTSFANANATLMDFSRGVSSALGDRFGAMNTTESNPALGFAAPSDVAAKANEAFAAVPGVSAYASDAVTFQNPTVRYADDATLWARGFAGQNIQQADGVLLRSVNQFYGGMIGGDRQVQADLSLGGFLGAGKTHSSIDFNSGGADSELAFGGAFGRYGFGASFLNMALQGGYSHNDVTRNINNNLAPGGLESATASYNGWYVDPEATIGRNVALGSLAAAAYVLTPSLQARYVYGSFGGYTESGTTAPLTVGSRSAQTFEERGQLKLSRTQEFAPTEMLTASISGGALGDERVGGGTIDATLLGQSIAFATPGKSNVGGGFGGVGLEFRAGRATLFASFEYDAFFGASSVVSGQGGIRVAF